MTNTRRIAVRKIRDPLARFLECVGKLGSCWVWSGQIDRNGYGRFYYQGKYRRAHRVAYELLKDAIPEGMTMDHMCRVRKCVNPAHLEPVTNKVNVLRGVGVGAINSRKTRCVNGHQFDEPNTGANRVRRWCRACKRAAYHKTRAKSRVAA